MEDYLISMGATIILRMLEDPEKRSKWRRLLVKLLRSIGASLVDDPEARTIMRELSRP